MPTNNMSIVLVDDNTPPDPATLLQAATSLGLELTPSEGEPGMYNIAGAGQLAIQVMDEPHPEALSMMRSPTSAKPETLAQMTGFYIVFAMALPDDQRTQDWFMARITAAVVRASSAVAAMLGQGALFYEADFFARMVENKPEALPTQVCVDITAGQEPDGRMSLLTQGLERYGHPEVLVVVADGQVAGGVVYVMSLSADIVNEGSQAFLNGDTVAGINDEPIQPVRAASPTGGASQVIRLDPGAPPPNQAKKKKKWFGRS